MRLLLILCEVVVSAFAYEFDRGILIAVWEDPGLQVQPCSCGHA